MLELVGGELGNCHVYFDMDCDDSEIYAIESLFLGKSTYTYTLESTDKDGQTINSEHSIMNGIPTPCIKYYAQMKGITALEVYNMLFNNKYIKFELTNDGNKFVCRNNKDHTVSNVTDFTQKCQYSRNESDEFFIN